MAVEWFTLRTLPAFPSIVFDGANFDEVLGFVEEFAGPERMTVRDGVLVAHLLDDDRVVKPGWSVSVRDGYLSVTSDGVRDLEWDQVDAPDKVA